MSRAAATATRLLATLGTSATLTITDPVTGDTSTREGSGAIVGSAKGSTMATLPVELGDCEVLTEAALAPSKGDRLEIADLDLVLAHTDPIYDRDTVAVWRCYGRRG